MSGVIDPKTGMPAQIEPVVIAVDKIELPVPTDDSKIMAQAAVTETGQLKIDPATLTLWIETAKAVEKLSARLDALESKLSNGKGDTRSALRAFLGDDGDSSN